MRLPAVLLVALLTPCARLVVAQASDTTRRASGATVSGIVHDSLAQRPLASALVQLVPVDGTVHLGRSATSDSLGRFTFRGVSQGRFTLGFFHPMLDSLGLEPPLREVRIAGHGPVRADLAIPSPARLRAAICGAHSTSSSKSDPGAVVVGVVRDARDRTPAAGVAVTAEWLELSFTSNGVIRRVPRLVAKTGATGWFALCNVPSPGLVGLIASRGPDSTDHLDVHVPAGGFLRRDLYLGPASPIPAGDLRLIGTVVTATEGRPVEGAEVSVRDGPRTRANQRGEWTLPEAKGGTRMLEVRALGFYPERRPVDVVPGSAPIRVVLSTFKAVLDTVKITAAHIADPQRSGFEGRRRTSGVGRYLTPRDIAQRRPTVLSDLFRAIPGMRLERTDAGTLIQVRGAIGDWCPPVFYRDGMHLGELTAEEVDDWVRPDDVAGIEIYTAAGMPPEFSRGMAGSVCGSVVIWTK